MGCPPFLILATMHFQCNRFSLNRSPDVSTKFGEGRSNSKEMATVFRNSDGGDRHLELRLLKFFDNTNVF